VERVQRQTVQDVWFRQSSNAKDQPLILDLFFMVVRLLWQRTYFENKADKYIEFELSIGARKVGGY